MKLVILLKRLNHYKNIHNSKFENVEDKIDVEMDTKKLVRS